MKKRQQTAKRRRHLRKERERCGNYMDRHGVSLTKDAHVDLSRGEIQLFSRKQVKRWP